MNIYNIPLLLEELIGDKNINPAIKQLLSDPIYNKRVKFLLDKGFDQDTIIQAVSIDKKYQMKNKTVVWIANQLKNIKSNKNFGNIDQDLGINSDDWGAIFDWVRAENVDLMKMNFESAINAATQWHEDILKKSENINKSGLKYETNNIIFKGAGFNIVELSTRKDLDVEGEFLGLCTTEGKLCGHYFSKIKNGSRFFSLRDMKNEPHVLMDFSPDGIFEQIQAKGNTVPIEKYKSQLYQWLSTEAPSNAKLTELPIERAMPEDKKQHFMKQFEQDIIRELESQSV